MSELFYWVLNMSILGAVTGLLIGMLRLIRRIPRRILYILWSVVGFRFLCPIGVGSRLSLYNGITWLADGTVVIESEEAAARFFEASMINTLQKADSYFPIVYKSNTISGIFRVVSVIWLAVVLLLFLFGCYAYWQGKREVRDAAWDTGGFYVSGCVTAPAVYGIFHAKIVLPLYAAQDPKDRDFIIWHEQIHEKRKDNLWRLIALLICCIHWFNPFVWCFFRWFVTDMELSCDECVLRKIGEEHRKEYAQKVVSQAAQSGSFASAFCGGGLKGRVEHILSYRRLTAAAACCCGAFAAAIIWILGTNAVR